MRAPRGTVVTEVSQYDDAAEYMRLYRQRNPDYYEQGKQEANARAAAARAVAKRHPDEFERAIRRERKRRGL